MVLQNRLNPSHILLLLLFSICALTDVAGQEDIKLRKNIVHGSASATVYPIIHASLNGYMERILIQKGQYAYFARVGYMNYQEWEGQGEAYLGQIGSLVGLTKGHLEVALGVSIFDGDNIDAGPRKGLDGSASIGWRYQKPGGHFVFRTGVAYPETIYVGVGFAL